MPSRGLAPVNVKRVYDTAARDDGFRVLVDRLWPRGVSKNDAAIDRWMKEVAPSADLRKRFKHDPAKWDEFRRRYARELDGNPDATAFLQEKRREGPVTLVYAAKNTEHNNAVALREYLTRDD